MGTQQVGLRDVSHGAPQSRARITAPLRYLLIYHPEKARYDFVVPAVVALCGWGAYWLISPKVALFGDDGLLRFVRDLLVMGVPFMVGALAAVAMGSPGDHLDKRPAGAELYLDGRMLSLRTFTCYLLGYLSFIGLTTLGMAVFASLIHHSVIVWTAGMPGVRYAVLAIGTLGLATLLSALTVTVFWALYFLTDVVNRQ
ncbi:MAG: hypothetical protein HIU81_13445 [Acidobacteria bacterium]|nr:hypothetical protein [Acidobacteriota bacterium]